MGDTVSLKAATSLISRNLWKVLLTLLLVAASSFAHAQQTPRPVQVGVYVSEPFVNKEGNSYSGMAIDIWHDIATRMNLASQYVEYPNYAELVKAVSEGKVEAAVTNLTITEMRACAS